MYEALLVSTKSPRSLCTFTVERKHCNDLCSRVTDEYVEVQDQTIDALEEKFHKKLSDFSVDVSLLCI